MIRSAYQCTHPGGDGRTRAYRLATKDSHEVHEQAGYRALKHPNWSLEMVKDLSILDQSMQGKPI